MTALPERTILDGSGSPSTSAMKTALGQLRDYLSEALGSVSSIFTDSSGNLLVGTTGSNGKLSVATTTNQASGYFNSAASGQDSFSINCTNTASVYAFSIYSVASSANTVALFRGYHSGTTQCFNIAGNGNVTNTNNSYGAISDVKLKENIADATPKLEDLCKVKVRQYTLKNDENKVKQIGVVAQEIEQVFAGLVEETSDKDIDGNDLGTTTKSVKYSVFVPMLIKAIQEQQSLIENLTTRLNALEGK